MALKRAYSSRRSTVRSYFPRSNSPPVSAGLFSVKSCGLSRPAGPLVELEITKSPPWHKRKAASAAAFVFRCVA